MPIVRIYRGSAVANTFIQMVLTCGSWQEAQRIADHLLEQRLIACAEFIPINSAFRWRGSFGENDGIKLVMESADHLYGAIETEIAQLHSYETFVLQTLPIERISSGVPGLQREGLRV